MLLLVKKIIGPKVLLAKYNTKRSLKAPAAEVNV
jgi:hypothetical protein